jgi:hypothetical protein
MKTNTIVLIQLSARNRKRVAIASSQKLDTRSTPNQVESAFNVLQILDGLIESLNRGAPGPRTFGTSWTPNGLHVTQAHPHYLTIKVGLAGTNCASCHVTDDSQIFDPVAVPYLMLARSETLVLQSVFGEEVFSRFSTRDQFNFLRHIFEWPKASFTKYAKYHTAAPAAFLLHEELPPKPAGFSGGFLVWTGNMRRYLKCRLARGPVGSRPSMKALELGFGLLQGVKRGTAVVSDDFIYESLLTHRTVLDTPPNLTKEEVRSEFMVVDGMVAIDTLHLLRRSLRKESHKTHHGKPFKWEVEVPSYSACRAHPRLTGGSYHDVVRGFRLETETDEHDNSYGYSSSMVHWNTPTYQVARSVVDANRELCLLCCEEATHELTYHSIPGGQPNPSQFYVPRYCGLCKEFTEWDHEDFDEDQYLQPFSGMSGHLITAAYTQRVWNTSAHSHYGYGIQCASNPDLPPWAVEFDSSHRRYLRRCFRTGDPLYQTEVIAICEPLKVRTITKSCGAAQWFVKPFQKRLKSLLDRFDCFRLTTRPLCVTDLVTLDLRAHELFPKSQPEELWWLSGDYKEATDRLNVHLSDDLIEMSLDCLRVWDPWMRRGCRAVLLEQELVYPIIKGRDKIPNLVQSSGQLMGSNLSFPILCLANVAVFWTALNEYLTEISQPLITNLQDLPVLINGDDVLFKGPLRLMQIWEQKILAAGFVKSVGKNYWHPYVLTVNSTTFRQRPERFTTHLNMGDPSGPTAESSYLPEFDRVKYLNVGLLIGQGKLGPSDKESAIWDVHNKLVAESPDPAQASRHFIHYHLDLVKSLTMDGLLNLFLSRPLGGLGFVPVNPVRLTNFQRALATLRLKRWQQGIVEMNEVTFLAKKPGGTTGWKGSEVVDKGMKALYPFGPRPNWHYVQSVDSHPINDLEYNKPPSVTYRPLRRSDVRRVKRETVKSLPSTLLFTFSESFPLSSHLEQEWTAQSADGPENMRDLLGARMNRTLVGKYFPQCL